MAIINTWVGYLTRSATEIKKSVLTRLASRCPEITDKSDSNILIIIIEIFAGIAEMLNYYIDNVARESFLPTVRRYSSILKLVQLIDYRVKAAMGYWIEMNIIFLDVNGEPTVSTQDWTLPKHQWFVIGGINYCNTQEYIFKAGQLGGTISLRQYDQFTSNQAVLVTPASNLGIEIALPLNYHDNTLSVRTTNHPTWVIKETLGFSGPGDCHFTVRVKEDGIPYLVLGDDINGMAPWVGETIYLNYFTTKGKAGKVSTGTIVDSYSYSSYPTSVSSLKLTVTKGGVAGNDIEDLESIRMKAPLSLRTLDRAVTAQDFVDIAKLAPGVGKAFTTHKCGQLIEVYVYPWGGGTPPVNFLGEVDSFLESRRIITAPATIKPVGETYLKPTLDITLKKGVDEVIAENDIKTALINAYSPYTSDINLPVRASDIIALIDNLPKVDFLTLSHIELIPYLKPKQGTSSSLIWSLTLNKPKTKMTWAIIFQRASPYLDSTFRVIRNGKIIDTIGFGQAFSYLDEISFSILEIDNPSLTDGEGWTFTTYVFTPNMDIEDFTVPICINQYLTEITINTPA